ncbi:MAG: ATP-dependent Clp protease adapter ClpS [Betaproteobacteria bacterium]|jgi:Uncharacterized conserved protein|nr:ATP-dependent Clp protease adapter ClpS [Betaproteobacteria bacterium]
MTVERIPTIEKQRQRVKPPPFYDVVLLNDDYTPMDFVVEVLERIFSLNHEKAVQVMLKIHTEGRAVCGTYSRDIAATRVEQVLQWAREAQHPLRCIMEEHGS